MIFTLLITRYQELPLEPPKGDWPEGDWPSVTVVVAAWNESEAIVRTLEHIGGLSYEGRVEVVVADNNSTDDTALLADAAGARLRLDYRRVFETKQGKHHALNTALATVTTPLVVTVDADTHLHQQSLTRLVVRVTNAPQGQHVSACAAALVAENPLATFVTRMQQWDYRLGINGVKRMQAAYNTALVAQGAFSAYWTSDLRAVGGWPDAIGEDIVLTWSMLGSRGLVQYEPVALGFTVVPERLDRLLSQRSRWARGMLEGLRTHPPPKQPRVLAKLVAGIDYLVPCLDIGDHLLLGSGSHPVPLRLPIDLRLVVDAPPSDHTRRLRLLAAVAGTPRLSDSRHPPASPTSAASSATCSPIRCSPPQPRYAATASTSSGRVAAGSSARRDAGSSRPCTPPPCEPIGRLDLPAGTGACRRVAALRRVTAVRLALPLLAALVLIVPVACGGKDDEQTAEPTPLTLQQHCSRRRMRPARSPILSRKAGRRQNFDEFIKILNDVRLIRI